MPIAIMNNKLTRPPYSAIYADCLFRKVIVIVSKRFHVFTCHFHDPLQRTPLAHPPGTDCFLCGIRMPVALPVFRCHRISCILIPCDSGFHHIQFSKCVTQLSGGESIGIKQLSLITVNNSPFAKYNRESF